MTHIDDNEYRITENNAIQELYKISPRSVRNGISSFITCIFLHNRAAKKSGKGRIPKPIQTIMLNLIYNDRRASLEKTPSDINNFFGPKTRGMNHILHHNFKIFFNFNQDKQFNSNELSNTDHMHILNSLCDDFNKINVFYFLCTNKNWLSNIINMKYIKLSERLNNMPENVIKLDCTYQELKILPKEIFKFKMLEELDSVD